jgi:hypothetical protein
VDGGGLADPGDQPEGLQAVEHVLERQRLRGAACVLAPDVERVAGGVQGIALRRLRIALDERALVANVADRARD